MTNNRKGKEVKTTKVKLPKFLEESNKKRTKNLAVAILEKVVSTEDGDLICICKNNTGSSGFDTSLLDGTRVEPDDSWDGIHLICNECEIVINQNTLEIVKA